MSARFSLQIEICCEPLSHCWTPSYRRALKSDERVVKQDALYFAKHDPFGCSHCSLKRLPWAVPPTQLHSLQSHSQVFPFGFVVNHGGTGRPRSLPSKLRLPHRQEQFHALSCQWISLPTCFDLLAFPLVGITTAETTGELLQLSDILARETEVGSA